MAKQPSILPIPLTKEDMSDTNHYREFVCGYKFFLNEEEFRLFVLNETLRDQRGYAVKLMYKNGRVRIIDFDNPLDMTNYAQITKVFAHFKQRDWINKGTRYHCYKYTFLGHGNDNKQKTIDLMEDIMNYIQTLQP